VYRESSFGHGTLDVINATTALWRAPSAGKLPVAACNQVLA